MRTVVKVLVGSGAFLLSAAAIYWFVSYERAGTILLSGTAAATLVMAAYAWLEIRRSPTRAPGDRDEADPGEGEGEPIASFTVGSPWPLVLGIGVAVLGAGLVFGPPLLVLGAILIVLACLGIMRESIA